MYRISPRVRAVLAVALAAACALAAGASDMSERGTKLFLENKPAEAVSLLELAVKEAGSDERLFLYLGVAYQQLGRWDDAIAAFRKGLGSAIQYRHVFLFNIANSFFAQGKSTFALEYYDQALAARTDYAVAYLNRANARFKTGDQVGAVSDYTVYLSLDPASPQAPAIKSLIERLQLKAADAERAQALAEAQRLAQEAARQALIDSVAQSLLEAAADTTSLSAGSGDLQGYDEDLSLDE